MPNLPTERYVEARQLRIRLEVIRKTIYSHRQPIAHIERCVTGKDKGPERAPKTGWEPFEIAQMWGGFDETTWFRLNIEIPAAMKGQRVVALIQPVEASIGYEEPDLPRSGEALAYLDGVPVQGLDRNREDILLTGKARGGERFELTLEACPSARYDLHHVFGYADIAVFNPVIHEFYWDCKLVEEVCTELDENYAPARQLMQLVHDAVWSVDLQRTPGPEYERTVVAAQKTLRKGLRAFETSYGMGKLVLAGHAHIDTAWLWPLRETQRKCARTFSTVLSLMDRYPEFHFSCSQPIQYTWIKTHYPELYKRIKQRVKEGRWELCGAPWVEPDHNVPCGEALIRQYLYGNRFFDAEFGKRSHIAWVPDSFGYTWSLPQIMTKCGLTAFITTKIEWSQFTKFPYSLFQWEGVDGTRICALMPPLNYNGNPVPHDCLEQWNRFKQKEHVKELPYPFGWGDGGGGPTPEMIERGKRMKNIVGMPQIEFGRLEDTVDRMMDQCDLEKLPVYNDELYLELHRGCQTSQARTKRNNRKCELLFRDAEFLMTLALLSGGTYENEALENAWKIVLTNQFHDILPGSSITEVYTTADEHYAQAKQAVSQVLERTIDHLVTQIDTSGSGTPVVLFNTLSWLRNDVAAVKATLPEGAFSVVDSQGEAVPHQIAADGDLLIDAQALPPLGYSVYRVVEDGPPAEPAGELTASPEAIENECVRAEFDDHGRITRLYDKLFQREVVPDGELANVLQLFDDRPQDWDAWEVDHNFDEIMWEPSPAASVEVIETGPVRAVVRFVRKTHHSVFTQDVVLHAGSPRIEFRAKVDWWEKQTLLKVAFPVDVRSSQATYEIQYGAIERPTHHNREYDRARFEVTAQRWADLSEGNYGVSLLNDCKYGYDVKGNVLRMSLLRSPVDPDPRADEGEHHFTYAIFPHGDDWRTATVQQGCELNTPVIAVEARAASGSLPAVDAFAAVDQENVIVDWVKRCEDSDDVIVRLYEAYGQRGPVTLTLARAPKKVTECNFMEEDDQPIEADGNTVPFTIRPYEIRTFKLKFE